KGANSTAVTSCPKETSTPFFTISFAKVLSKSARGTCQVWSQPEECFFAKSKLHTTPFFKNRAPAFISKFCSFKQSKSPVSSKWSIQRGNRLSPITKRGKVLFSTTLQFIPLFFK